MCLCVCVSVCVCVYKWLLLDFPQRVTQVNEHTAAHCNALQHLQHAETHCNTLQHTATHCNTWMFLHVWPSHNHVWHVWHTHMHDTHTCVTHTHVWHTHMRDTHTCAVWVNPFVQHDSPRIRRPPSFSHRAFGFDANTVPVIYKSTKSHMWMHYVAHVWMGHATSMRAREWLCFEHCPCDLYIRKSAGCCHVIHVKCVTSHMWMSHVTQI